MVSVNTSIPSDGYVCILKCKQAEVDAVERIPPDRFVPLFEVPSVTRAGSVAKRWGPQDVVWVQPLDLEGMDPTDWAAEVTSMFDLLRDESRLAVPTVVLDEDPETLTAVANIIAKDGVGVVIRLDAEDILTVAPADLALDLDDLLNELAVTAAEVDLVVDAGLARGSVAGRIATAETALATVPLLADWRSLVLALSGFPDDMGTIVPRSSVHPLPRADRAAYLALLTRGTPRVPVYADYAVGVPTYPSGSMAFSPIPNIKYTSVDDWMIHRADSKQDQSAKYIALATQVAAAPHFRGAAFSAGDAYIADVASGSGGPGSATTYLRAAISHHVCHVLDRLATHGEP